MASWVPETRNGFLERSKPRGNVATVGLTLYIRWRVFSGKKIIDNCCNRLYLKYMHYLYVILFLLIPDSIFQDSWFSASQGALHVVIIKCWKSANDDIVHRDPTSTTLFIFCLRWCYIYNWTLSRKNRKFWVAPDDQPCHFRRKRHYSEISGNSERKTKCSWSEAKQPYFSTEL